MRSLDADEALHLHRLLLTQSGGLPGVRDQGALESALAQPHMTFGGQELYATLVEKALHCVFPWFGTPPSLTPTSASVTP